MSTRGHSLLLAYVKARRLTGVALREALIRAAERDPLATPRDVPALRYVYHWLACASTPSIRSRRLLALATGGRLRKDNTVGGSPAVPEVAWREAI